MTSDAATTATPAAPAAPPANGNGDAGGTASPKLPRWRRILVGVLVVLGCLLVPLSVLGVWIHNTLLNTDQWVATVGPLVDQPAVQTAVAKRLSDAVINNAGLEPKVKDLLPDRAKGLASTITAAADQAVIAASTKIVESDQFATLWKEINRRAHTRVVAVLKGDGDTVQTKNGEVVLQLQPLVDALKKELDSRGISFFDDVTLPKGHDSVTIFASEDLRSAQSIVSALDTLAWVLPIAMIIIFGAAILLSGNRRRTILRSALGVALAIGVLLTAFNLGRSAYLGALPSTVNHDAAADVYDQVLSFLRTSARTVFVLAIIVALGAWLVGPGKLAVRLRSTVQRGLDRTPSDAPPSPVADFVSRNKTALRVCVLALAGIVLIVMTAPSPWAVLIIAVLVLVALGVIEVLGRAAATPGDPDQPAGAGA
ncbi:MAG: hypothetical protein ACHQIG_03915 [Acidimicrobiia bacterium]